MTSKTRLIGRSSNPANLYGRTFNKLCVYRFGGYDKHGFPHWWCACECGKDVRTRAASLLNGHTKSCGCFRTKHGLGSTKTYYSWVDMKRRCFNKDRHEYRKYGGRGISVCKRWLKFSNFLKDMGIKPEGKTLDRINGKKGYSPNNCRWATHKEQILNRSLTKWVTYKGETLCIADMARKYKILPYTVYQRLYRKWPLDKALTVKPDTRNRLGRNV